MAIQNSRSHSLGIDSSDASPPRIHSVIDSIPMPYRSATHEWPSSWSVTPTRSPSAAASPMIHGVRPTRSGAGSSATPERLPITPA